MRVLASSDWHLGPDTAEYVWATIRQLSEYADKDDILVVCGDLLEQARSLDGGLMLALSRKLRAFPGPVYIVPGNHDQIVLGDWESSPLVLLKDDNVSVVESPLSTDIGLMVPYTTPRDWPRIVADAMRSAPASNARVVWAHQGFKGAYQNLMRRDRDGLGLPPGLRTTITGHYHMPQNLGPLVYCGSPYQTNHAETGQVKSFLAFDSLDGDTPLPTRVPFDPIGPRYWTLIWDPADDAPALPDGWREGDIVRVVADATRAQVRDQSKRLRKAGLGGATIVARPSVQRRRADVRPASSVSETAQRYVVGVNGPDANAPDPFDVIEFAQEHDLWPA